MTRLKQAWLALCGKLEPEVREVVREVPVIGEPLAVKLYMAQITKRIKPVRATQCGFDHWVYYERSVCNATTYAYSYYTTCEQAHKEHPGQKVTEVDAIRIGKHYFNASQFSEIKPQPKPKIAKGKRRNGE